MKSLNLKLSAIAVAALASASIGCGSKGGSFTLLPQGQTFQQSAGQTINPQMDILWVVDNSGSMQPLQQSMTANFTSFINEFQTKGFNFQLAVTTSDAYKSEVNFSNNPTLAKFRDGTNLTSHTGVFMINPLTTNLVNTFITNAMQGDQGSGDERIFSSMRDALASPLNPGFLRTGDFMAVIILSDEDDFSGANRPENSWIFRGGVTDHNYTASTLDTVASYVNYLDTFTMSTPTNRSYNVSAITVMDATCLASHKALASSSIIGQRYLDMVDSVNTGLAPVVQGVKASICGDYATQLQQIAASILTLSTKFVLASVPVASTIVVTVNGTTVPNAGTNPLNNGGWSYDTASNSILFTGALYIPPSGATIGVNYTPASYGN